MTLMVSQVFVIRVIEKKIDPLIDPALLEHSPLAAEFDHIQFESEWSFFKNFTTPKRKPQPVTPPKKAPMSPAGSPPAQTTLPNALSQLMGSPTPGSPSPDKSAQGPFSSLRFRSTPSRSPNPFQRDPLTPPPTSTPNSPTPTSITTILTAVHTLLSLYGINPILIVQANSQVLYWTACELFNRLISRKKYLCRSRAIQVGMNVGVLEEWVTRVGLPKGVSNHFACVRQLLSWLQVRHPTGRATQLLTLLLQCLSSINDFAALIDTIQTMKAINPLQMRRAVKDYRYEVNEGRMTEECSQYLAQMQKDWERQRIKMGVELARKEVSIGCILIFSDSTTSLHQRRREREEDIPSSSSDEAINDDASGSSATSRDMDEAQRFLDNLFDPDHPKSEWTCPKIPEPLGELMNSRYMLPLILPSDPARLCAAAGIEALHPPGIYTAGMDSATLLPSTSDHKSKPSSASISMLRVDSGQSRSESRASHSSHASVSSIMSVSRGPMRWRDQCKRVRDVELDLLDLVGGVTRTSWSHYGVRFLNTDVAVESAGWGGLDEHSPAIRKRTLSDPTILNEDDNETTPSARRIVEPLEDFKGENGANSDARSVSSFTSGRSHLTPNFPRPTADKRRSIRLARRSSGGETAMPLSEYGENSIELETPMNERPLTGLA